MGFALPLASQKGDLMAVELAEKGKLAVGDLMAEFRLCRPL